MIAVIQRVNHGYVNVNHAAYSSIQKGIVCFLGVHRGDSSQQVEKLIQKIVEFRIFSDEEQKMNLCLKDVKGELLLVSQFTLTANTKKGKRPSFDTAEEPKKAEVLYNYAVEYAKKTGVTVKTGVFQSHMQVGLENDGPVTFIVEV